MIKNLIENIFMKIILGILKTYKYIISPILGTNCRFLPSCADYAQEAISKKGIIKGCHLSLKRLTKCHPWGKSGYDPLVK